MVQARLEGLDAETRRVLRAASIFGAIPPPTNTPPVARHFSARFPASAPYISANSSTVFAAVASLEGGILAWKEAGLPTKTG